MELTEEDIANHVRDYNKVTYLKDYEDSTLQTQIKERFRKTFGGKDEKES